jgi:hypothetical protein
MASPFRAVALTQRDAGDRDFVPSNFDGFSAGLHGYASVAMKLMSTSSRISVITALSRQPAGIIRPSRARTRRRA